MKCCISVVLIGIIVSGCPALTIFQTWDVNDWTKVNQSGSTINIQPSGAYYITATPFQRNGTAGYAGLYKSIGTLIPAGTTGGSVPKCWLQYDYRYDSGMTSYTCMFGLYRTGGSNDYPATSIEWMGVQMGGQTTQATQKQIGSLNPTNSANISAGSSIERIKMHIYTYDGNTVMDVNIYAYDLATDTTTLNGSLSHFVVLDKNKALTYGWDAFGLRNTNGGVKTGNYSFDNMYFSTEGPNEETVPPPFGMTCTNSTGDFTGDCKVDFKDLAVVVEEWLNCAMVPARLCYSTN
jgi:hypothetical protein